MTGTTIACAVRRLARLCNQHAPMRDVVHFATMTAVSSAVLFGIINGIEFFGGG